nr:dihydroxyacetone phosphate acyltransferase [Onthophagus taurus]
MNMGRMLDDFEDILIPRRTEISNWVWALRHLNPVLPCAENKIYTPEKIKLEVLRSHKIVTLIDRESQNDFSKEHIINKIRDILNEIGYCRSVLTLRILAFFLAQITTRICQGIYVNKHAVDKLKTRMGNIRIMYVPSHRSYADFILMSYVLYHYDIDIPAIAAGMDFHGMKGMGTVLRNTGAFFMRRSYNSDSIYWDSFREYVHQLVTKGDKGIEFFVEGTRSRTGKSLYPKFGLLTMILRAYFNSEVPDILFVPINISYDRIMEEKLFGFELLGVPKPKESTSGFFKSLSIINENFGKVFINFGDAISAHDFFNGKIDRSCHNLDPVYLRKITESERRATSLLAQKIVESQQKLCTVTTFNLISAVFANNLNLWQTSIDVNTLLSHVKWMDSILRNCGAVCDFDGTIECLLNSIEVHHNLIRWNTKGECYLVHDAIDLRNVDKTKMKGHQLSEKTMLNAVPLVMLQLYVNPILHYFINPALVVTILRRNYSKRHKDKLLDEFNFLRSVFAREFVLFPENSTRDFIETLDRLNELNSIDIDGNLISLTTDNDLYHLFQHILEPFLLTYYILCNVLTNANLRKETESDIISETQKEIEKLFNDHINEYIHPYSLSLDTISNCLQNMVDLRMIQKIKRDETYFYQTTLYLIENLRNQICDYLLYIPKGNINKSICKL